jgi:hypothetical protein
LNLNQGFYLFDNCLEFATLDESQDNHFIDVVQLDLRERIISADLLDLQGALV